MSHDTPLNLLNFIGDFCSSPLFNTFHKKQRYEHNNDEGGSSTKVMGALVVIGWWKSQSSFSAKV